MKIYLLSLALLCSACGKFRPQTFHASSKLSAPDNVYISNMDDKQITLAWNPSKVVAGPGSVTAYVIYRNNQIIGSTSGKNTSYQDSTVWPLTDYTYQVAALSDDGGRSSLSAILAVKSLSDYVTDDSGNILTDEHGNPIIAR